MARSQPLAVVGMEILVKQNEILPRRVVPVTCIVSVGGTDPQLVDLKQRDNSPLQLVGHFLQRHGVAAAGGTFDLEIVPVVMMKLLQKLQNLNVQ